MGRSALARLMAGQRPGKGGITRGRADAPLHFLNNTAGDTAGFGAKRLPRGKAIPKQWEVVGVTRSEAEVDPQRDTGAGGAGAAGSGEVSWQRRLAPRHRKVVRKFFSDRTK